jgi:hypothetical protein
MTHTCRKSLATSWHRRQQLWSALRHARIVTDPKLLAYLNAEIEKRKLAFPASATSRDR